MNIVLPNGERLERETIHESASGRFAVIDLRSTPHKGTVDVFHIGTGLRATPPRHFETVRNRTIAKKLCEALDDLNPVDEAGNLLIGREEYHAWFDSFVAGQS